MLLRGVAMVSRGVAEMSRHAAGVSQTRSRHVAGVSRHVLSVSRACPAVSRGNRSHVGDISTCVNTSTCLKGPARLGGFKVSGASERAASAKEMVDTLCMGYKTGEDTCFFTAL